MKLQTQIPLQPVTNHHIDYNSKLMLLGSCFSDHIGEKCSQFQFKTESNPVGILFHAKAIENLIEKSLSDYAYTNSDVFFLNEQYQCFEAHSKLNGLDEIELTHRLNSALKKTKDTILDATHIVITLGTAWVYKHKEQNKIVANCHKVPQKEFEKQLLSTEEIYSSLQKTIDLITSVNQDVQFLFTVSPVRHIKDGFVENTLSKAHLIAAIHQIISKNTNTSYFPSYEIVMDELRDYRFYNNDMIHPSPLAVNYIWKQFSETWMTHDTLQVLRKVESLIVGYKHKPFNPDSEAHKKFLLHQEQQVLELQREIPHLKF